MGVSELAWWLGLLLGAIPLLVQAIWYWNDVRFLASLKLRSACGNNVKQGGGKLPPGHMGLPFLGETLSFLWYNKILRRPDDFIHSKRNRYGEGVGMYRSYLFGSPTIITCSPASNKFVLQSAEDFRIGWPAPELAGRDSIINVEGKQHARLRGFILDAINQPNSLRRIARMVQPRMVSALQCWAEKGTINALLETNKVTFENICSMFISMEPGPRLDEIHKYFEGLIAGFRAYPISFPGTPFHHALRCRKKLAAMLKVELEKRKQRKSETDENNDLMDSLMRVKDEEGKQLSDDEVVDNMITFVIGGYKSTALAMMWALYHISKSPEVLQRLREENTVISKRKKGDFITMEDVSQMKYTAKVVEETIRLANPASSIFRVANRDVDYKGFVIPKGWQVLVWIRSLHIDAKNFDNPLSFNPERWNRPPEPGTYQVFGGGPRICAGNMLARLQLTIILHHLALGYKWELLNPKAKLTYTPYPKPVDGAAMTFHAL
ncbi:ent-kaurenoic acid oxidase 1 isoform X2 [Elaeis guineensis]|uniref:Ent-kaurenoic acid oxidase 1 isoform X2 n=1 Tax=Elaeis guineensis var. tenera TaxID=51953 RepID=A0A6I9RXS8_ELAGV|nr:ent-kaurenoic acid oxidase 1 isoform X2 [Elaeis guineensis]